MSDPNEIVGGLERLIGDDNSNNLSFYFPWEKFMVLQADVNASLIDAERVASQAAMDDLWIAIKESAKALLKSQTCCPKCKLSPCKLISELTFKDFKLHADNLQFTFPPSIPLTPSKLNSSLIYATPWVNLHNMIHTFMSN